MAICETGYYEAMGYRLEAYHNAAVNISYAERMRNRKAIINHIADIAINRQK